MPIVETEVGDKRPPSVKRWQKNYAAKNQICGVKCPKHTGAVPGFCERSGVHVGVHSHELREGQDGYDPRNPKGCAWDVSHASPKKHRRSDEPPEGVKAAF